MAVGPNGIDGEVVADAQEAVLAQLAAMRIGLAHQVIALCSALVVLEKECEMAAPGKVTLAGLRRDTLSIIEQFRAQHDRRSTVVS